MTSEQQREGYHPCGQPWRTATRTAVRDAAGGKPERYRTSPLSSASIMPLSRTASYWLPTLNMLVCMSNPFPCRGRIVSGFPLGTGSDDDARGNLEAICDCAAWRRFLRRRNDCVAAKVVSGTRFLIPPIKVEIGFRGCAHANIQHTAKVVYWNLRQRGQGKVR